MSGEFTGLLASGEEVVMSDSGSVDGSGQGKLVLTNKRLLFCGSKGFFNREFFIRKEVALKDIANVNGDIGKTSMLTGVTGNSWLVVKTKGGEEWRCGFFGAGAAMWDFNMAQTQAMNKVTSWVTSIKLEMMKSFQ